MLLALFAVVLAGGALAGPARCVATWSGPATSDCALRGELKVSTAGPSEKAAEKAVKKELQEVVGLAVAAQRARIPTQTAGEFAGCAAVVAEDAYVNCFSDETLAEEALCFVELADAECWTGQVRQVEGVGWQAVARGRDEMCKAVDDRLVSLNWTDLEKRRAVCAASCATKTTVRCPSGK